MSLQTRCVNPAMISSVTKPMMLFVPVLGRIPSQAPASLTTWAEKNAGTLPHPSPPNQEGPVVRSGCPTDDFRLFGQRSLSQQAFHQLRIIRRGGASSSGRNPSHVLSLTAISLALASLVRARTSSGTPLHQCDRALIPRDVALPAAIVAEAD